MINYNKMNIAIERETFFSIDNATSKITMCFEDDDLIKTQDGYSRLYYSREICSLSLGDELFNFLAISHDLLFELSKSVEAATDWDGHHNQDKQQQYIANFNSIYIYLLFYSIHRKSLGLQYTSRLDRLAKEFEFALNFCCNDDFNPALKELSSLQRYYLYSHLYVDNIHTIVRHYNRSDYVFLDYDHSTINGFDQIKAMGKTIDATGRIKNEYESVTEVCPIPSQTISSLKDASISLRHRYSHQRLEDYLMEELFSLISLNCRVKKCACCGKYFILKGDYATDCCDRIPEGEKYSCKKIMAQKKRKELLRQNPIIREYNRAYKRYYARVANKNMTNEQFRIWVDEATKRRDIISAEYEAAPSDILVSDFKKYLGNK